MDIIDSSYVAAGAQTGIQARITAIPSSVSAEIPRRHSERVAPPPQDLAPKLARSPRPGAVERSGQSGPQQLRRELRFTIREHSDRVMITVMNADNDEVIRQIPLEETVRAGELLSRVRGLLLDTVA